jgi:hypothetical protein
MRSLFAYLLIATLPLQAGDAFFVTFPVQSPVGALGQDAQAASIAGVRIVRDGIPGEEARQLAGPDGPEAGRIFTRPDLGSYVLTDVGSQWNSALSQGQNVLALVETYPGQFGWEGKAFVGAIRAVVAKGDIVQSRLSLAPVLMDQLPVPQYLSASASQIDLSWPPFLDSSHLASGLVLYRRKSGSPWEKISNMPLNTSFSSFSDSQVSANASYQYGLSARYPWTGGGQAGQEPTETDAFVSWARSESAWISASAVQPSPTPFSTLVVAVPTPDLGNEAWLAYPNPNRDGKVRLAFRIAKQNAYELKVFGIDGTLVHRAPGTCDADWTQPWIDLSKLGSGVYLLKLSVSLQDGTSSALPLRKLAIVR